MAKRARQIVIDKELLHLTQEERHRQWAARVEAVIFASSEPVTRKAL
jgi:segregation and condensation protein B